MRCCPRQNKIGPCLGAAGADKFSDSNNSKMRKRKLYRSMGAVLAFSQVFSSSVRRGLSEEEKTAFRASIRVLDLPETLGI